MQEMLLIPNSVVLLSALLTGNGDVTASVSDARIEGKLTVHDVDSEYQSGRTQIRIMLPENADEGAKLPVLYMLPVEVQGEHRYGDGIEEAARLDLANKYRLICVAPTFSQLPWYADHPTDSGIRQESHLLKVVVPFIDQTYPTIASAEGRLLIGFSKSGHGAFSLLLRHPDLFGKAAAWDAPLMMESPGRYGSDAIFDTQENFDRYRIDRLLRKNARALGVDPRLILTGYDAFREEHQKANRLLTELRVPHFYRDGPHRRHDWHSGWLSEAVQLLMKPDEPNRP